MGTEWMLLAVPKQDYDELKHMVDFRQEQRGEASAPSADQLRDDQLAVDAVIRTAFAKHKTWPEGALRRLAEGLTITTQRFTQVMDLCADAPRTLYSTEDVAERTGMTINEWRAACRKMNSHLRKNYPDAPTSDDEGHAGEPMWPLVGLAGRNLKVRDQLYVGITEDQAKAWRAVR